MASDLERFRDHCTRMAEGPGSRRDRAQWRMLAGEADAFLRGELDEGAPEPEPEHEALF